MNGIPSPPPEMVAIFILVALVAFIVRVLAGWMDDGRVRDYIEGNGWRFISVHWAPFGTGWLGEKSDRIYEVRYIDQKGNEHHAYCKTSMGTGVYLTEDRIVRQSEPQKESLTKIRLAELELENRQLREKLKKLDRRT